MFDKVNQGGHNEAPEVAQNKGWVQVQKKTFTNWFRDRVKDNGSKPLNDIENDLKDGKLLLDLMRVLTEGTHGTRV